VLSPNLTGGCHSVNPESPAPPAPSPALAAALAPLRRYRSTVPPLSTLDLLSLTPEQFAARALTWDLLLASAAQDEEVVAVCRQVVDRADQDAQTRYLDGLIGGPVEQWEV